MLSTKAAPTGSDNDDEYDRHCGSHLLQCHHGRTSGREKDIGRKCCKFSCVSAMAFVVVSSPADVDPHVAVRDSNLIPACPVKRLRCEIGLLHRPQSGSSARQCAAPFALLRPRRERPSGRRAAEQRDELAPPDHSITSSARASRLVEWRPSAFAVLRLITSSNLVGCCTGKSAGLTPFRRRPT